MKPSAGARPKIIAVIGSSACDAKIRRVAFRVGELIAQRGARLICGGYGGVMEAAAEGAKSAGGITIGVLSGKDKTGMNAWIDIPIVTGMRDARNVVIARSADGVVAVSGEFGTLSEIAFTLLAGVPIVGIDSWDLRHHGKTKEFSFPNKPTPEEAIETLFSLLQAL